MEIEGRTILITGANRGIGQALVTEALSRGVNRVYAGTRGPLAHPDGRPASDRSTSSSITPGSRCTTT
jgi:NAD(P)-dependent dehydrogenase (short-subunit alcohol dehydrogenase family)